MTTFKFSVDGKEYIITAASYREAREKLKKLMGAS